LIVISIQASPALTSVSRETSTIKKQNHTKLDLPLIPILIRRKRWIRKYPTVHRNFHHARNVNRCKPEAKTLAREERRKAPYSPLFCYSIYIIHIIHTIVAFLLCTNKNIRRKRSITGDLYPFETHILRRCLYESSFIFGSFFFCSILLSFSLFSLVDFVGYLLARGVALSSSLKSNIRTFKALVKKMKCSFNKEEKEEKELSISNNLKHQP